MAARRALPIGEVKALLEVRTLPEEDAGDYHTLGGRMMLRLGRIPAVGDHFEWDRLRFQVVDMDGNRVDKVLVAPTAPHDSDRAEAAEA